MLEDTNFKIVNMHICSFYRKNGILTFDMNKYPQRLCVFDKENKMVIDVETCHQYPYIRVTNMQDFYNADEVKTLDPNKRVGCMEYTTIPKLELDLKILKRCRYIIKQLNSGIVFPNGNDELTNEQYINMINNIKNSQKVKKIGRKEK